MPLRLLHAADVWLDAPLRGIGTLPRDAVDIVAQATLIAWERLIDAAITHDVEALLLTGNTFDAATASLAADVALRQGCERLAEKQIPLFVTPGPFDPVSAWQEIPALPDNLTHFRSAREEGVELTDRGRTLVVIQPVGPWSDAQKSSGAARPLSVGLWWEGEAGTPTPAATNPLSVNLDLVCCRQEANTAGWFRTETQVQRQSSPQGMTAAQTGPRGATLIEADGQRKLTTRLLPLAPVRRERLPARLDPVRHRDDLCDQMLVELEDLPAIPGEQLRLIDWVFTGSPASFKRLELNDETAREIAETLTGLTDQPGKLRYVHQAVPLWLGAVEESQMSELWRDYLELLDQRPALDAEELKRLATELRPEAAASGAWERGLQQLDPPQIAQRARRYGRRWFAGV
jgi:exonuclease SbcD